MIPDALMDMLFGLIDWLINWLPRSEALAGPGGIGFHQAYEWIATANYYFPITEMAVFITGSAALYTGFALYKFIRAVIP